MDKCLVVSFIDFYTRTRIAPSATFTIVVSGYIDTAYSCLEIGVQFEFFITQIANGSITQFIKVMGRIFWMKGLQQIPSKLLSEQAVGCTGRVTGSLFRPSYHNASIRWSWGLNTTSSANLERACFDITGAAALSPVRMLPQFP